MKKISTFALVAILLSFVAWGDDKRVVGHEPRLEKVAEIEASFAKLKPLLAKVQKGTQFTLYEGISRIHWDDNADGKTHKRFGYSFYDKPQQVSPEKLNELRSIIQDPKSFVTFGGFKACGGFHPDFSLLWNTDEITIEIHVCFGCHEIKAYTEGSEIYCDIEDEAYKKLKEFLSEYEIHRPKHKRG